jgi:hypothetical protein
MRATLALNGRKAAFPGLAHFGKGIGDGGHSALPGRSGIRELEAALGGLQGESMTDHKALQKNRM